MRATPLLPWQHALALSLAAGLAFANVLRAPPLLAVVAGVVALLATAAPPSGRVALLALALLLVGWFWASMRLAALDESVLESRIGETQPAIAVVTGPVRRGTFALRVPARVERFGRLRADEPVLLELPLGRAPPQGARLRLVGRVVEPRRAEASFDERTWLRRKGIHVVIRGARWRVVGRRGGLGGLGDRVRGHLARTVAAGVGGERRAVVAGIVLGEDEGLPDALRERFRAAGLYHLLAVSGQNIALLAGGVLVLAWLLGIPRWLGELSALGSIAAYVLAVGWQPSVVRAGVAGALASLAWLAARPRDRWYFLLLGAIVLLAWNPYSLLEPGFQLSFAAVAAIFVAVPRLERRLEGYPVPRPVAGVVAVSAVCGLATAPLVWLHFGAVPLFSVLANAFAAPAVAPLLGLGLGAAAIEPVLPSMALAMGFLNGWLAAYLALCARLVGGLPQAELTSGAGLALLAALGVSVAVGRRLRGPQRGLAALLVLVVAVCLGWRVLPDERPPPAGLRITFLDVGQGDAVLVETAAGAMLVDQGPPEGRAAEQLSRMGVKRIALLVLTHPQRDHVGGAAGVLERIPVDLILDPRLPSPSRDESAALAAARSRGVRIVVARTGAVYRLGALRIAVLWPDGPGSRGGDPNERAVVLLVSYGEIDALLTADAEANVTARLRPPAVEILKVAHHGSADPLLPQLLQRTRPRVAVISVGAGNDYGHPTPSTLRALDDAPDLSVYRTDRDGQVTIEADRERLSVRTEA